MAQRTFRDGLARATPAPRFRARLGTLVAAQIRAPAEKRGFAETRLLTHWEDIVGADIAAVAVPLKITYGRGFGGTLDAPDHRRACSGA
jgi:hypothetical protein